MGVSAVGLLLMSRRRSAAAGPAAEADVPALAMVAAADAELALCEA